MGDDGVRKRETKRKRNVRVSITLLLGLFSMNVVYLTEFTFHLVSALCCPANSLIS